MSSKQPEADFRSQTIQDVNNFLQDYALSKSKRAAQQDEAYRQFWEVIGDYLAAGGKRLRPYLVVLAYKAYGGKQPHKILPVAAAWELLHACLLVHDDIIDRDFERHNQPNIAGVYRGVYSSHPDAHHYANAAALLARDAVLAAAYELVASADISPKKALEATQLLSNAVLGVVGGELLDTEGAMQDIATVDTYKIAELKTAEYSFYYPLACGAMLADAPSGQIKLLQEFSQAVGLGFQLVDDLLGVFGDSRQTGKSVNSDIRERKRTVVMQKAFKLAASEDAKRIQQFMNQSGEPSQTTIEEVRQIIEVTGAKQAVEAEIAACKRQALLAVDKLTVSPVDRLAFREGVRLALDRQN